MKTTKKTRDCTKFDTIQARLGDAPNAIKVEINKKLHKETKNIYLQMADTPELTWF